MDTIEINGVSKAFGNSTRVFSDFSLSIRKGEVLALVGPNGCGKTTLLHMLAGFTEPDAGSIEVFGKKAAKARTGFICQDVDSSLFPWLSCRENIGLATSGSDTNRIARTMRMMGLGEFADFYPYQLSGGLKQKLAIARAHAYEPDLFLLDEPFSALDYGNRIMCEGILSELFHKAGKTAIVVSHDIEDAVFLADRVVVLSGKPALVRAVIEVGVPRPRKNENRFSAAFERSKKSVFEALLGEGNAA